MKKYLAFLVIILVSNLCSQLKYVSNVNTSAVTNGAIPNQLASQGMKNIYIAFKRGTGSTAADKEIKIAISNDAGISFAEKDISTSGATSTYMPLIASTPTSVVVLYSYADASGQKVKIFRSTDNGQTFSSSINSNSNFYTYLSRSQAYNQFKSNGNSNYYLISEGHLFVSIDDGITFNEVTLASSVYEYPNQFQLAATQQYVWLVRTNYPNTDSILIYRGNTYGTNIQQIAKYSADLPRYSDLCCSASGSTLYIGWTHEEIGTFYLRTRTLNDNVLTTVQDIATSANNDFGGYYGHKYFFLTPSFSWIYAGDKLFHSNGSAWTKGALMSTEIPDQSPAETMFPMNDTTVYLHGDISSTGSLRQHIFANVKWVDFPISRLKEDTTIIDQRVDIGYMAYVGTKNTKLQLSLSSNFATIVFDTTDSRSFTVTMKERFLANGSKYYYESEVKMSDTTRHGRKRRLSDTEVILLPQRLFYLQRVAPRLPIQIQ